jgi:hypothetical protein
MSRLGLRKRAAAITHLLVKLIAFSAAVIILFSALSNFFYTANISSRPINEDILRFQNPYLSGSVGQLWSEIYPDEVDLRIIVLTYNRSTSLLKLLGSLDELELDGDTAVIEIWIDVNKNDQVSQETVDAARSFKWTKGPSRVHIQPKHAGIYGQWIDTWRPNPGSRELCLFLEDDLSVSPMAYRFIKAVHRAMANVSDYAGVTLQSDLLKVLSQTPRGKLAASKDHTIFMYKGFGTWGFSPNPEHWRRFRVSRLNAVA